VSNTNLSLSPEIVSVLLPSNYQNKQTSFHGPCGLLLEMTTDQSCNGGTNVSTAIIQNRSKKQLHINSTGYGSAKEHSVAALARGGRATATNAGEYGQLKTNNYFNEAV
jgi:hypothetical protein